MNTTFKKSLSGSSIHAEVVSWDSSAFGFGVGQILFISLKDGQDISLLCEEFDDWVTKNNLQLLTIRIEESKYQEINFLQKNGFQFIEMTYSPSFLIPETLPLDNEVLVSNLNEKDVEEILGKANNLFRYGRYHVDTNVPNTLADIRYMNWILSASKSSTQRLLKASIRDNLVAFFLYEELLNQEVYWHLTAVMPEWQGRGYGKKIWTQVMNFHHLNGCKKISTCISARNIKVLNLYSRLEFNFCKPMITLHKHITAYDRANTI